MARLPSNPAGMVSITIPDTWTEEFLKNTYQQMQAGSLQAAKSIINQKITSGQFQSDPKKRQVFLRNRGRETRRQMETIDSRFLRIPYQIRVVDLEQGIGKLREATLAAYNILYRRAPYHRGTYQAAITIYLNDRAITPSQFALAELGADDRVLVGPMVHYALTIERGFARNYYTTETIPGGVVRPVARMIRQQFAGEVSARFVVVYVANVPSKDPDWRNIPLIELAGPGRITAQDANLSRGRAQRVRSLGRR